MKKSSLVRNWQESERGTVKVTFCTYNHTGSQLQSQPIPERPIKADPPRAPRHDGRTN